MHHNGGSDVGVGGDGGDRDDGDGDGSGDDDGGWLRWRAVAVMVILPLW